jgi:hypothetical protein
MSKAEQQLAALRAARDSARADLLARIETARPLADPKTLGQRIKVDVEIHAQNVLHQAMEIAADNRGVLAGTLTALLLWGARTRIGAAASASAMATKAQPKIKTLLHRWIKRDQTKV